MIGTPRYMAASSHTGPSPTDRMDDTDIDTRTQRPAYEDTDIPPFCRHDDSVGIHLPAITTTPPNLDEPRRRTR